MTSQQTSRARHLLACVLTATVLLSAAARADTRACPIADDLLNNSGSLPQTATTLRAGGKLDILAVGSATMLGPLGTAAGSFSDRMVSDLRAAVPDTEINLAVFGTRGASALHLLATIRAELGKHPYKLVMWQTGTVEAVRRVPPVEFRRVLAEGAALVHAAGADLLLIDPQFSRMLVERVKIDPYNTALHDAAAAPGIAVFPRMELMQRWVQDGNLDLEQTPRAEREEASARLQACLGQALARMVLRDAGLP